MENKKNKKNKFSSRITDEDLESYKFGNNNISKNIKALPVKKKYDSKKDLRPIPIDSEKALKQKKLNILGIDVYFPYEPYQNQKIYMEKVIQACKNKTIAGLESPTGTGKTLCLLCASLAYLRYERKRLIDERNNNFDIIDNTEKIRQPVIYYTSRTHAQLSNVIQELQKTCYRPINSIISSREQLCVNEMIRGFHGHTLNMRCQFAQKNGQCKYFKGKNNLNMTWSAYDGKTIDELKTIAKKSKFCPFFFERDKSIHSDLIFLPYNYIFEPSIKKKMKIQMNNAILIIDEAHNIQEVCNDAVSKDFDTNTIDEVLSDLKNLKNYLEETQIDGGFLNGINNAKLSKHLPEEPINIEQVKNEINILNNIRNALMKFQVKSGDKWPNFGLKLEPKELFDLFYLSSKENKEKQTTIKFNNNLSSSNFKFKSKNNQNNPPTTTNKNFKPNEKEKEKNSSNNSQNSDEEDEFSSDNEYNIKNEQLEIDLTPENIPNHINYLNNYEFFIHNDKGQKTLLGQYIEILELIKLLSDNFIKIETIDDPNPLHNFINNFKFFIEDVVDNKIKNSNIKKKNITNFIKKKNRILHIYCFNPGFGFKKVLDENLHASIITSGTLSPIDGMESELKCSFEVKLEGTHVIDKKQVHFGILTSSIFNKKEEFLFNANNRNNSQMINNLGTTILELCKITPGGILVFFSSYGVMEDFIKKWEKSKIISEISKYKEFCQDKHDQKLNKKVLEMYQKANSSREMKGAILFSVCRGSCSEGMNFKNDYARLVIVVGIPYAYLGDPKTQLRKEYQDEFNKNFYSFIKDKKIKKLSGSEWYNQNAIKCVNQALGRVIRHSNDYGCMLLIDSRYQQNSNKCLISKWIRDLSIIYNNKNNDYLISNVEKFFNEAENFVNKKINDKKKLDELKLQNDIESNKKSKKYNDKYKNENLIKTRDIINKLEKEQNKDIFGDEFEQLINDFDDNLLINNKKGLKNLPKLNNSKHFSIINDIKIDERKNNNNKKKKKNKKNITPKEKKAINNENNNLNLNDLINGNVDFDAISEIFGDDIEIKNSESKNQNINYNSSNIKKNNYNSSNIKKNEENSNLDLMDELKNFGTSFFESLKEESNNKSSHKKNIDNNYDNNENKFSQSELIAKLKIKKNEPKFKEELRKIGLSFNYENKNDSDEKNNFFKCPLCFESTNNNSNIKPMSCECGHCICNNCVNEYKKNNKILICPAVKCKQVLDLNKARILYI